jgi:hypothetical protein
MMSARLLFALEPPARLSDPGDPANLCLYRRIKSRRLVLFVSALVQGEAFSPWDRSIPKIISLEPASLHTLSL